MKGDWDLGCNVADYAKTSFDNPYSYDASKPVNMPQTNIVSTFRFSSIVGAKFALQGISQQTLANWTVGKKVRTVLACDCKPDFPSRIEVGIATDDNKKIIWIGCIAKGDVNTAKLNLIRQHGTTRQGEIGKYIYTDALMVSVDFKSIEDGKYINGQIS